MKKNNLLVNVAGKALALAAAMMMSVAFTACSNDDDTPPAPQQETFTNTVTIDGRTMPVVKADYAEPGYGTVLRIFTSTSTNNEEWITIVFDADLHTGKNIDLAKKETDNEKGKYWEIFYQKGKNVPFVTDGSPMSDYTTFTTGTLRIDGKVGDELTVQLKNGKVTDGNQGDGRTHTVSVSWKGTPPKKV